MHGGALMHIAKPCYARLLPYCTLNVISHMLVLLEMTPLDNVTIVDDVTKYMISSCGSFPLSTTPELYPTSGSGVTLE